MGEQGHELLLVAVGFGQVVGAFELGLLGLTLGQIMRDTGERADLLVFVEQRCRGGLAPEPRAVLTNLPADTVRMAGIERGFELVFWLAATHVFRRKKAREMVPDNFRR